MGMKTPMVGKQARVSQYLFNGLAHIYVKNTYRCYFFATYLDSWRFFFPQFRGTTNLLFTSAMHSAKSCHGHPAPTGGYVTALLRPWGGTQ